MNISFSQSEQLFLHEAVQRVLDGAVKEHRAVGVAELPTAPEGIIQENMGAFVTYSIKNARGEKQLRGCIGIMSDEYPLLETITLMAYSAAMNDQRFLPISESELPFITWSITVLGPFSLCPHKDQIVLGTHGLMLEAYGKRGVFLPQVPVEQGWNLPQTLEHLCNKAQLPAGTWQEKDAKLYWYEGIVLENS